MFNHRFTQIKTESYQIQFEISPFWARSPITLNPHKPGKHSTANIQCGGRDALAPSPRAEPRLGTTPVPTGEGEIVAASGGWQALDWCRFGGSMREIFWGKSLPVEGRGR